MAIHGKLGSLKRASQRSGGVAVLKELSNNITIHALKDGRIYCRLGKSSGLEFIVEAKIVLQAAEAGVLFAQELTKHSQNGAGATELVERITEAGTLPAGSQ